MTKLEIEKGLRPIWSTPSLKENLDNHDNKQRDMRGNKKKSIKSPSQQENLDNFDDNKKRDW